MEAKGGGGEGGRGGVLFRPSQYKSELILKKPEKKSEKRVEI